MANTLRIKRRASGQSGAPSSLANAELAFSEVDDILYYGEGTGGAGGTASTILAIGGPGAFVNLTGAQTISGDKTYTGSLDFSAATIGDVTIGGNLTINGTTTTVNSTELNTDDKNITLNSALEVHNIAITPANTQEYVLSDGTNSVTVTTDADATLAELVALIQAANGYSSLLFTVSANSSNNGLKLTYKTVGPYDEDATLTPTGSSAISATNVTDVSDASADSGGITLRGTTDKTIKWIDSTDAWTFSEHIDLASGKEFYINGTSVLNNTTLGANVVSSSLESVGTISTGTWQGSVVGTAYGGTGLSTVINGLVKGDGSSSYTAATEGTDYLSSSSTIDGGTY